MTQLQSAAAAAGDRVFDFLTQEELPDESGKIARLPQVRGEVEFDHVRFSYPSTPDKIIIKDFSAHVSPGQKVAIVGPTGAGKTTMVNLLMRFYDINSGDIRIDGVSTSALTRECVHSLFGMVLQDTWLFEGTVCENLAFGKPGVTDEELSQACRACGIYHFIQTLPQGFDTVLGEDVAISAGQKQLFTIARAMIQNSPMLILDEATSSVDTRTELITQQAMDRLTVQRTSFEIAHRLSIIKNADLILVMKDGDIIEQGDHETLLAQGGFYAELYSSQFENAYSLLRQRAANPPRRHGRLTCLCVHKKFEFRRLKTPAQDVRIQETNRALRRKEENSVLKTRWNWDDIKQHFAYTWWAYVLAAVLMIFSWQMAYHATEYDPPADKKLQITIAGDYVSTTVLEYYEQRVAEEFPELERVTVDNIPLDFTGEGDYSGYTKLQVVVACGEGDIYLLNRELLGMYGEMGAFEPLDDLVTGGELAGMFTGEELARGTLSSEEIDNGAAHVYGIPADRLYGMIAQGVDTSGLYIAVTSYTGNPEYAQRALVWLCDQTKEEPPAWMNELEELEEEMGQTTDELPEIG